ncbi:MAG: hypothetical protein CVV51_11180 [Spirochaetae bacterium HGW-Spirochaetae-7]|jgi:hypothetical protein|nr:MAG: hypothetical protein CVV51_11180 [Spirochaetae bacterium HGW-Spirochaetae-7]
MKHCRSCLFLALALLLASCIGIDANGRIAADGAVELLMTYTVSTAVDELGKLGANAAYLPLPVGRDDMELAATRAGGQLRSWSRKDGGESFTVTAALAFPSVAAFASFLDPEGKLAVYGESGGTSTLSLTLSGGISPTDPDLVEFVRVAFADYTVNLTFDLPRIPKTARGFTIAGRKASFSMKAADLYASAVPVAASVSW